jgi:hypothetical protein
MAKSKEEYIMNVLRQGTLTWEGRNEVMRNARKLVQEGFHKNGSPKMKYYWYCALCYSGSREESNFEADHISEVGPLVNGDWNAWIDRLYADPSKWQCICISCHKKKTAAYAASRSQSRKKIWSEEDEL